MTIPYTFRLLARIGSDQPVELMRSKKHYHPHYFQFFRREMDRQWTIWVEMPLLDSQTVTKRVKIRPPWMDKQNETLRFHI